jgi:hypothetical protein
MEIHIRHLGRLLTSKERQLGRRTDHSRFRIIGNAGRTVRSWLLERVL